MAWLTGWSRRRSIVIPTSRVGATLSHFPILLKLSNSAGINDFDVSSIFTEVGSSYLKIAVTQSDGVSQLYVEVEKWDSGSNLAWLWVSRSTLTLSAVADNVLYIYYDRYQADNTTYVGLTRTTPAESVWDSNFKFVSHMADNPSTSYIMDSSLNRNDGTKVSAGNPLERTSGIIGNDQTFSSDYITIPLTTSMSVIGPALTMEAWCYFLDTTADQKIFGNTNLSRGYLLGIDATALKSEIWDASGTNYQFHRGFVPQNKNTILAASWQSGGSYFGYVDGTLISTVSASPYNVGTSTSVARIGVSPWNTSFAFVRGAVDEVRLSTTARSVQWLNACNYVGMDNFIQWGIESYNYPSYGMYFDKTANTWLTTVSDFYYPAAGSVCFWMVPTNTGDLHRILGYNNLWEVIMRDGRIGNDLRQTSPNFYSTGTVTVNTLNHVACVYAGTGWGAIYINGLLDSTTTLLSGSPAASGILGIGTRTGDPTRYDGYLEDVRIYNRVLSAAEIATIYACRGCDGITYGLMNRWRLDEGPMQTLASFDVGSIKDSGPNQLNCTAASSPTAPIYTGSVLKKRRGLS